MQIERHCFLDIKERKKNQPEPGPLRSEGKLGTRERAGER